MLSSLEILVFVVYLSFVFSTVALVLYFNPGKQMREAFQVEDTEEKFVQAELEEPSSESEQSESEEEYIMTENPMLRQRRFPFEESSVEQKEIPWVEQVD